jgi:polar amino acid transport system substrate-binding protein
MDFRPFLFAVPLAFACAPALAGAGELVLIAPMNHAMPLASFSNGSLSAGILKDLGEALASRVGRQVRFVAVPSKRVSLVLAQGGADGVCYVQPHWIDGDFQWSAPFIPNAGMVLAHAGAPVIRSIGELRGQKVGTVAGYRYTIFERALGEGFLRDDAPSTQHNLLKLAAGRTSYALVDQATALYEIRNAPKDKPRIELAYESSKARCAFSRHSKVPFAELTRAIDAVAADGTVERILARYR